jgi:hypothetical protein
MNFLLRELLKGFKLDPARRSHSFGVISSALKLNRRGLASAGQTSRIEIEIEDIPIAAFSG